MTRPLPQPPQQRLFSRRRVERTALALIALGLLMMAQPFFMVLFTYSLLVTLIGTVGFALSNYLPE
ncbi:MAG: hypothetical protein ACOVKO_02615 [Elstera sp.]